MAVLRKTDDELLQVVPDKQGKIVTLTTPAGEYVEVFSVSLSWKSIGKLEERLKRKVVDWKTKDGSLRIYGASDKPNLRFTSLQVNGLAVDIALTEEESSLLKRVLLQGDTSNENDEADVRDISSADVRVEVASEEVLRERNMSGSSMYCVTLNGEILRTPKGTPILHESERAMRELAAEQDYSDELSVGKISLFNLCCTQIEFIEGKSDTRSGCVEKCVLSLPHAVLNDLVIRTCAGPEVLDQMKYLAIVEQYLKEQGIAFPHLPQIYLDDDSGLSSESRANLQRLSEHVSVVVDGLGDCQRAVFNTVSHVFESPLLGVLLATEKIVSFR
jgi:hypothetical protein